MFNQQHVRSALLIILAMLQLFLTGIGVAGAAITSPIPLCRRHPTVDLDPNNFSNPTQVDNPWLPLVPGTQFTLQGEANRGGGLSPHRVVFTVSDVTKVINGVRTVIAWDRDFNKGQLLERELAFFAQDNNGNVWNLGEYPEEFNKRGNFIGTPDVWITGLAGAQAGIHMLANPQVGGARYLQGWAPGIKFFDCAKVLRIVPKICVPFNCYENLVLTDEVSPLEGGGHQRKYHASGVGIVKVGTVRDPEAETLSLVKIVHLSPEKLAQVRESVLSLDSRAYRISPDLYGQTPPAEYIPPEAPDFEAGNGSSPSVNPNSGQVQWIYLPVILK